MKAGIWGAGGIAMSHAQAIASAGIRLAAVVDVSEERAAHFAQQYGADRYGINPEILFDDDVAAIHICAPPNLHEYMAGEAIQRGKAVLCEKPLCINLAEAVSIANRARDKNILNAVNFNLRYHLALGRAREKVTQPDFGEVVLVHGSYLQEFHALPAPYDWRYDKILAGKMRAVTEIGTHWFDIAQVVSGKQIESVCAVFGKQNPVRYLNDGIMINKKTSTTKELTVESEDSAIILLRMIGGALASVVLCETSLGRSNRLSLEVTGQNQSLWWNSEDIGKLHSASKGSGVNTEIFAFGNNGFIDSLRALTADFYNTLRGRAAKGRLPDFMEAANIVAICEAVYESALADGTWAKVQRGHI